MRTNLKDVQDLAREYGIKIRVVAPETYEVGHYFRIFANGIASSADYLWDAIEEMHEDGFETLFLVPHFNSWDDGIWDGVRPVNRCPSRLPK